MRLFGFHRFVRLPQSPVGNVNQPGDPDENYAQEGNCPAPLYARDYWDDAPELLLDNVRTSGDRIKQVLHGCVPVSENGNVVCLQKSLVHVASVVGGNWNVGRGRF